MDCIKTILNCESPAIQQKTDDESSNRYILQRILSQYESERPAKISSQVISNGDVISAQNADAKDRTLLQFFREIVQQNNCKIAQEHIDRLQQDIFWSTTWVFEKPTKVMKSENPLL